jgi:hypothetical protein
MLSSVTLVAVRAYYSADAPGVRPSKRPLTLLPLGPLGHSVLLHRPAHRTNSLMLQHSPIQPFARWVGPYRWKGNMRIRCLKFLMVFHPNETIRYQFETGLLWVSKWDQKIFEREMSCKYDYKLLLWDQNRPRWDPNETVETRKRPKGDLFETKRRPICN